MHDATRAYLAGFLDGDGSIIFQLVRRKDYVYGFQIRASVCFYQSTRHRAGLEWLKQQLGCGYIRDRAGSMSDYTIVGWSAVKRVLESEFLETAQVVDAFATLNYSKRKHINSSCVEAFLNGKGLLVPVTTEAFVPRSSATAARVSGRRIYRDDHTPAPGNGMKI